MIRRWLPIFGYLAATLVVIAGTFLLIAYGNGYSYDLKTGKLIHRGLIIVNSSPSGANITLNGRPLPQKTSYRNTFEAGWYDFILTKSGYRTWQKRIQAIPSVVSLVDYVILLPQHFVVDTPGIYSSVNQFMASRDRHKIAFVVPASEQAGVWVMDTGSNQQARIYTSAPASPTTAAESVTLIGWSDDNSHMLVKSQIGDTASLLVLAANGSDQPVNLTNAFQIDGGVSFSPSDWHQLWWQSADGLRKVDLGSQTVSAVLADHVAAITLANDRVLYVDNSKQPASLWSVDNGGHKQKLVAALPASQHYELAFANYLGTPEVAVVAQDQGRTTLYSNIYDKPTVKTLSANGKHAQFNGDGRFLLQYDESHVATYDLERLTTYVMPAINSTVTGLNWFDDYHLVFNRGGQIVMSEFDGNYAIVVTRGDTLPPFGSADGKTIAVTAVTSSGATAIKSIHITQ